MTPAIHIASDAEECPMLSGDSKTHRSGFSLFEMLMVLVLLAVAIVPMLNAFGPTLASQSAEEGALIFYNRARGTLSRVMCFPFSTLNARQGNPADPVALFGSTGEAARESFVFRGTNWQPAIAIADASGGTGGLLRVSVRLEDVTLSALKADY